MKSWRWLDLLRMLHLGVTWFCFFCLAATPLAQGQGLPPDGYHIRHLSPAGAMYVGTDFGGGPLRNSAVHSMNAAGQIAGTSDRYSDHPFSSTLGRDAWRYSAGTFDVIGLVGGNYETEAGNREADVRGLNDVGHAIGITQRQDTLSSHDAWFFDGNTSQQIGFVGSGYEFIFLNMGVRRVSEPVLLNDAGLVAGFSNRYSSAGDALGRDAWLYDAGNLELLGLTGADHAYFATGGLRRHSEPRVLNNAGAAAGYSTRFRSNGTELGQDVWVYDGDQVQQIGLTGSGYEYGQLGGGSVRQSDILAITESGLVAGYSNRWAGTGGTGFNLGRDSWLFDGATTTIVGLEGGVYEATEPFSMGLRRYSQIQAVNESGQASGFSSRFPSFLGFDLSQDAWYYDGETTQQIGLVGDEYEFTSSNITSRYSEAPLLTADGKVAGLSNRYGDAGVDFGRDTWFFDGDTTSLIGLTGNGYEIVAGGVKRESSLRDISDAGHVVGQAQRYSPSGSEIGMAGWYFDPESDTSTPLEFSFRTADNFSFTDPQIVTDSGVVLGNYTLFADGMTAEDRAFWWSMTDGFHDLGDVVAGGINSAGWLALSNVYGTQVPATHGTTSEGAPRLIVGQGAFGGQTSGATAFLLTALSAPTVPGDYDGNGAADAGDYTVWASLFGQSVTPGNAPDGNGDGIVDAADYVVWRNALHALPGSAHATGIPEPASAMLWLAATALSWSPRRGRELSFTRQSGNPRRARPRTCPGM